MRTAPDLRERVNVPRSTIPAVTHVDYSARVQTVDETRHGRFYRLLETFYRDTGCPVLVNTSFNVRGEPIVCTPADAYRCFVATDMDALVLGDVLLVKDTSDKAAGDGVRAVPRTVSAGLRRLYKYGDAPRAPRRDASTAECRRICERQHYAAPGASHAVE